MKIFGSHEDSTIAQMDAVVEDPRVVSAALMADGHLGYGIPIGGAVAYENHVPVVGVGYDIACGNAAIRTDLTVEMFDARDWGHFANEISRTFKFGVGGEGGAPLPKSFTDDPRWQVLPKPIWKKLRQKAVVQAGSIGSGNHYIDILADNEGRIWIGVHFGSRGFGYAVAQGFLNLSHGEAWDVKCKEKLIPLSLDNPIGADYWAMMELCGDYAYLCRDWVVDRVAEIIEGVPTKFVHNHHNFAWKEQHDGDYVVVVRKGCTPAWGAQRSFVGGSMGDDAVILTGATPDPGTSEHWLQRQALFSTVHGAGRTMSRTQAKKTFTQDQMEQWLDEQGVILKGGGLDESPMAYRRLNHVLRDQGPTINIEHTLKPIVVCMASGKKRRGRR